MPAYRAGAASADRARPVSWPRASAIRRALLAATISTLACCPAGAGAAEALPDLVADAPVDRGLFTAPGEPRLLLRFDGFIRNTGAGAAELRGAATTDGLLTDVRQRIYTDDGSVSREIPSPALVRYEHHVSHSHFHLQSAARYSLWTEDRLFEVTGSEKAGFCLTDSAHTEPQKGPDTAWYATRLGGNPEFSFCSAGNPTPANPVVMGISSGWRDDYPFNLAFQWLDVSALSPGRYRLAANVDPDNVLRETDERNPVVFQDRLSVVPGYLPLAQNLGEVNPFVPHRVTLGASSFERPGDGGLGPPSFALTRAPACGRLSGKAPELRYKPARPCRGHVSFEFGARDATSAFPTQTPTATVRLRLGTRRALSRTRLTRRGRRLLVRMRSIYRGRLRATALDRGRQLGSCAVRAREGRRVPCLIRLAPAVERRGIRVRTALRIRGRTAARRLDRLG